MSVTIEVGATQGLSQIVMRDFRAMGQIMPQAAVRAARGARSSLRRQISSRFKRKPTRGGAAFANTLPKIRPKLEDYGGGKMAARVRTMAWYKSRRGVNFDLFWLFDNAPITIRSTRGRMIAVPLPGANLPNKGGGAARTVAWPRDLQAKGWRTSIIPAGRGGLKNPLIVGGPPGTPRSGWKPLYTLHRQVRVSKRLPVGKTAERFGRKLPTYAAQGLARLQKRIAAKARTVTVKG
jgi:hypothetical protein